MRIDIYSKVNFPILRSTLICSLIGLSDKEMQLREWVSKEKKFLFWSTLRFDLEFLYDDIVLYDSPEDGIGYIVINQEENNALRPVYQALDEVCDKIGEYQPDSAYINSPLWDRVVETSQKALAVFMKNEDEARKLNPVPWNGEDDWGAA